MNWETLLGSDTGKAIGKQLDQHFHEWKTKGMNGTAEQRDTLLKEAFHGARFNGRLLMLGADRLGMSREKVLETLRTNCIDAVRDEAKRAGFDGSQSDMWVGAHVKAYDSLAEEFGLI